MSLREKAIAIEAVAKQIRLEAKQNPPLIPGYNAICDVLDELNDQLDMTSSGMIPKTWNKL